MHLPCLTNVLNHLSQNKKTQIIQKVLKTNNYIVSYLANNQLNAHFYTEI